MLMPAMAALLSSCGTTFMVAADDMYGTMPTREQERRQKLQNQWNQTATDPADIASNTYAYYDDGQDIVSDTFNYDDYYDYEYSSRLRRFQSDDYLSSDYYSDYYTNSYWYNADPYYYGTSIYLGYNWWYPSYSYYYRPGWYMSFGYDPFFTYGGWGYRPYRYGWGYGSYSWGYNDGFWDGYWAGRYDRIYDYCYNPYDRNTYTQAYYGRRTRGAGSSINNPAVTRAASDRRVNTASAASSVITPSLPSTPARRTFAERYEQAVSDRSTASQVSTGGVSGGNSGSVNRGDRVLPAVRNQNAATPSGMMESASSRLENKVTQGNRLQPVRPGNDNRRVVNPAAQSDERRTAGAVPSTNQQRNSATSTYRGNLPPVSTPSTARPSGSSAQPRQYSNPVYERSRSTSSYVSPQYNNGNRNVRTTSTPSRSSSSSVRSSSYTPSRSSSSGSSASSGSSSSTRRTR